MKVSVDQNVCVGSGSCVQLAPAVFDQREQDGIVVLLKEHPAPALHADIRQAARCCPSGAIRLDEPSGKP
jgi:ferredoxin